jgi:hypothetical protein
MLWTTCDETLLAPACIEPLTWSDWLLPDVDGFGLPLVGSLLAVPLPERDQDRLPIDPIEPQCKG